MPVLKAQSDDGRELHIHIPQFLSWVLGLCGTAIVAAAALLINLNLRVTALESTRMTDSDGAALVSEFVPRAEYEARELTHLNRLDRIETKIDRLLESR